MPQHDSQAPLPQSPNMHWAWLPGLYALFFAINLLTSAQYPVVWIDEVMFVDPAINLYLGDGFTSTAWPYQDLDRFFAGYPPLYSLLLTAWIYITAIDPVSLRAMNYLLIIAATVAILSAAARKRWIIRGNYRVLLALLILTCYSISMSYRSDRPDTLMLLMAAGLFLTATLKTQATRTVLMFTLAALFPFVGLQLVMYTGLTTLLVLTYVRKEFLKDFFLINGGMFIGLLAMLAIYAKIGVLSDFINAMQGGSTTGFIQGLMQGHFDHQNALPKDLSFLLLFPTSILTFMALRQRGNYPHKPLLSYSLVASIVIPAALIILGKFPTYYSWMIYVPLSIAVVAVISETKSRIHALILSMLTATCLVGLPFQLLMISYDWADRSHDAIVNAVHKNISASDWALTDYGAYFAVKTTAKRTYSPHYTPRLTAQEKDSITVIIAADEFVKKATGAIGGKWYIADAIKPQHASLTERLLGVPIRFGMFDRKYELKIYRREK
ncbi:MAG: hypothetical protein AABY83_12035 [Pseudomonadota bacterium]